MAKIRRESVRVFGIERFGGLNLKDSYSGTGCEASRAVNFELKEDGSLGLRPGSRTLVELIPEGFEGDRAVKALWAGRVAGNETLLAAAGGCLWELREQGSLWQKRKLAEIDTGGRVCIFGFSGNAYILSAGSYLEFNGSRIGEVGGYAPLIYSNMSAAGEGAEREERNMLTSSVRVRFNVNEGETLFRLPSSEALSALYVKDLVKKKSIFAYSFSPESGYVQINEEISAGENALEICFSEAGSERETVLSMEQAEIFGDGSRPAVFLCGSRSNKIIFSACDGELRPRADYFPLHGYAEIGEENVPVTGIIRQQSSLLIFKKGSIWELAADRLSLPDGRPLAAYYIRPINRSFGSAAPGALSLVENHVRTIDAASVLEWLPIRGSGSGEREQRGVSSKIAELLRSENSEDAVSYYDREERRYYLILSDGRLLVQNILSGDFFCYEGLGANLFLRCRSGLLFGSQEGKLCILSPALDTDDGRAIRAEYKSLELRPDYPFIRKNLMTAWISAAAPAGSSLTLLLYGNCGKTAEAEISPGGENEDGAPIRRKIRARGFSSLSVGIKTQSKLKINALYLRTEGSRLSR